MKTKVKEIYVGDTVLREYFAESEMLYSENIEIEKVVKAEGTYFINYTACSANGYTKRTEIEVEPLEIMEMINTKINNFIEEYKNTENE